MPTNEPQIHSAETKAYAPLKVTMSQDTAQEFVNVLSHLPAIVERWGIIGITVGVIKNMPRATLGWSSNDRHEIQLRPGGRNFQVILHEISHQYCDLEHTDVDDHGVEFARTHLYIARAFLGPHFEMRLKVQYDKYDVSY